MIGHLASTRLLGRVILARRLSRQRARQRQHRRVWRPLTRLLARRGAAHFFGCGVLALMTIASKAKATDRAKAE